MVGDGAAVIERLPIGVFAARIDITGNVRIASQNAEARRILGEATRAWSLVEEKNLASPEDRRRIAAMAVAQRVNPRPAFWEGGIVTAAGVVQVRVAVSPAGHDGDDVVLHGSIEDITDLVAARRALEAREQELAEAQRAAKVGSWRTELDGRNTWSDEMCRIHGLAPGDPVPDFDAYVERFESVSGVREARAGLAESVRTGTPYESEYTIVLPDGRMKTLLARGTPVCDPSGAIIGQRGSCVDITDLVLAREALAASERLHRTVVHALAEGVVVQDPTGAIIAANPAAERILGIRRDEITGLTSMDPRWEGAHEDGTPVPGGEHPAMVALRTGEPVSGAVMQISHPERDRVWLRINASPLRQDDGDVSGVVVSFEDITAARAAHEAELRFNEELERRVRERTAALAAANEELRVFSATVSHDLRAPVRAVAGFARLLQKRYAAELPAEAAHWVDNLVVAGETMGRLIDDFLAYARFGADGLDPQPVDLAPIVEWLRSTLVERMAETEATLRVTAPLATPIGDAALLRRMLLNLVDNAISYARPGVPPEVVIAAEPVGDQVVVSVSDNGRGIEPPALERIFEVFARVEPGQDVSHTGIGLAMVRKAARAMGTDVTVESLPNAGTTFRFSLPAAPAAGLPAGYSILPVDNPTRVG